MRRLIAYVSVTVFLDITFFAALTPLLPHLVSEFGLSKTGAGVLTAANAAGALAGGVPSALVSTRVGVRSAVLLGLTALAAGSVGFALAGDAWLLIGARFVQGVGTAFTWTGCLAWLVSAAPHERRGELLGRAMGASIVGALAGPVLGGAASGVGRGPAFGAIAALAVVLALVGAVMEPPPATGRRPLDAFGRALHEPDVAVGVWLTTLPAFLFGVLAVLAPLELDRLGWGAVAITATFLVSAGLQAGISPAIGRLTDRRGRLAPVRVALVTSVALSLALPWPEQAWLLGLLVVAAGLSYTVFWVPGSALISDGSAVARLDPSIGFALMNMSWAPGAVIGATAAGALAARFGNAVPFVVSAGVCASTLVALRYRQGPPRRAPRERLLDDPAS